MAGAGKIVCVCNATLKHIKSFATDIATPLEATWEPIKHILEADADQDFLTKTWHESKLDELRFVGLMVCHVSLLSRSI